MSWYVSHNNVTVTFHILSTTWTTNSGNNNNKYDEDNRWIGIRETRERAWGQRQQQQRAQTTPDTHRLGHRCVFLSFSSFFYILINILLYIQAIIYTIHASKRVGQRQRRQRAQMAPDTRHLGHRWVFPSFSLFFYTNKHLIVYRSYNLPNTWHGACWTATATRKSPNDAHLASFGL